MNDKTILCAIDFSESSLQALNWTMKMARLTQSQVTVLFCYRLIATGDDEETTSMKKNMEHEAVEKFHEIEKRFVKTQAVSYKFVTEVGFFPYRIETFIRKSHVGLLVMGDSIVTSFNEFKNLSFEQFLNSSKIPVVVVPEKLKEAISV